MNLFTPVFGFITNLLAQVFRFMRQPSSPQKITRKVQGGLLFQQDLKAIDPKTLAAAMGNPDGPPEEPLFSSFEDGFGYFTTAAVGRSLKQYDLVRKVSKSAPLSQL